MSSKGLPTKKKKKKRPINITAFAACVCISGKSYKASTIVIYDSKVVPDLKIPHIMSLDS